MRYEATKVYTDITLSHRAHNHKGHCQFMHGHGATIEITFSAREKDDCGFVVDFGQMEWVKEWIEETFDHTMIINSSDPEMSYLVEANDRRLIQLVIVDDNSCEGLAEYIARSVEKLIRTNVRFAEKRGVRVERVTLFEDSRNKSTFTLPHA